VFEAHRISHAPRKGSRKLVVRNLVLSIC